MNNTTILFYSKKCIHSQKLLKQLYKNQELYNNIYKVSIEEPSVKIPKNVKSVPTLIIKNNNNFITYVGEEVFDWFRSISVTNFNNKYENNNAPNNSFQNNSAPNNSFQNNSAPNNSAPNNSAPNNSAPNNSFQNNSAPNNSAPNNSAPNNSAPNNSAPNNSAPNNSGIQCYDPVAMSGGFSDSFSNITDSSPMGHCYEFIGGVDSGKINTAKSSIGEDKSGKEDMLNNQFEKMLENRNNDQYVRKQIQRE